MTCGKVFGGSCCPGGMNIHTGEGHPPYCVHPLACENDKCAGSCTATASSLGPMQPRSCSLTDNHCHESEKPNYNFDHDGNCSCDCLTPPPGTSGVCITQEARRRGANCNSFNKETDTYHDQNEPKSYHCSSSLEDCHGSFCEGAWCWDKS